MQKIEPSNIDVPHEVVGDFLASLARVVNHRRGIHDKVKFANG
jgi:hypothetical protein